MNFNGISYFTNAIYHKCQDGYLKKLFRLFIPIPLYYTPEYSNFTI